MRILSRLGRAAARLAPAPGLLAALLATALILPGCSDDDPVSRNTPLQPGTQGSGEPDFVLLWNAGPETARLSDELAAFVERAFYHANGQTGQAPPTSGVLQETPGGSFQWTAGSPGGPFEIRTLGGRVLTLTIHSASSGWQAVNIGFTSPYDGREVNTTGLDFDVTLSEPGYLEFRVQQEWIPPGDPRLDVAESVYDGIEAQGGYERTVQGTWLHRERTFTVTATHRGTRLVGPHIFVSEESFDYQLEAPGEQVLGSARIGFSGYENFYAPGGSGGIGWKLEQEVTHSTGGVTWSLAGGACEGSLGHAVWYWPLLVPDAGGWAAGGELRRNGEKIGRFAFTSLIQPGTPGEPLAAMQGGLFETVQPAGRPAPVSLFDDPFIHD